MYDMNDSFDYLLKQIEDEDWQDMNEEEKRLDEIIPRPQKKKKIKRKKKQVVHVPPNMWEIALAEAYGGKAKGR